MPIRTRYAPSPTGYLHVGGLRTALYNYLLARRNGGRFVLRVEDTDQTRRVEGAIENLYEVFAWLGLDVDEGPAAGGPFGPYVQSERLPIYAEHVRRLTDSHHGYPCFCSTETLEAIRADQAARGLPPMYDRRCRKIARNEALQRVASGEPHVWRMAVPHGRMIAVNDLIRGTVEINSDTVDDQVLVKSDGFPTYHLANVVDDHLMEISHVVRGEEWLTSTPKHILLYEFFEWEPPRFAHLPLLLNPDRSKMSKRTGDVAVEDYRRRGMLPEALLNYIALLGWHPGDDRELFTLNELIHEFSLERVGKAGAVFDVTKLFWVNSEYLKMQSDELILENVRSDLRELIETNDEARVRYAVATLRGGVQTCAELVERVRQVFAPVPHPDHEMEALLHDATLQKVISDFLMKLAELDASVWNEFDRLEEEFKIRAGEAGQAHGIKGRNLWRGLRAALTGQPHGPELAKLVGIWGRERTLSQVGRALDFARGAMSC
ncbi:glutamate--tRNA ligase [bacterium]|nr:glutamate--tRNA ligase [bacterium]MBU1984469.1 glutamate--tRNA ligase [bacterium]